MSILSNTLCTALKRTGFLVIACGLLLTTVAYAQSSSSSYNPQYGNSPYYNNQTYNNHKTPRYTGTSALDHWEFEGGGGVTPAAGSTQNYANVGWNILLGGGYKFNDRLSLLAEWN